MKDVERICVSGNKDGRFVLLVIDTDGTDLAVRRVFCMPEGKETAVHSMLCTRECIYAADSYNNSLYRLDMSGRDNQELTVGRDPRHMAVDGGCLYVTNFESDNISIVDTDSFTLTGSVPADIKPHDIICGECGQLYISCYEQNKVLEYSYPEGNRRYFDTEGKPMHLAKDGNCIIAMTYFTNGSISSKINFIDIQKQKTEDIIKINGLCSAMDYDILNKKLYIVNIDDKNIYVIDTAKRSLLKMIHMGGYPEDVSCGLKRVYVTNSRKGSISFINSSTAKIEGTAELGFSPDCIKFMA